MDEKVTINTDFNTILERGKWDLFCKERGINPWCLNEGLEMGSGVVALTLEEAQRYNIITNKA